MAQNVIKGLLSALVILNAVQAQANEKLVLTLRVGPYFSEQVRDGQVIGHGQISMREAHLGYQVWLDALKSGAAPNQYVITGKNNARHELRVVIGRDGWIPDSKTGNGVIKQTSDIQANFNIVALGNQTVPADEYRIIAQGAYLEP
ncbi:invasin [Salmonella enterica subsp. enterica serovar Java]|uniref:Invasin n=1 Tax=Salmonella enterica I TaxID=59201 RepID=A0A626RCJ7_SALET|nr:invasin [Salmonella enterica subsp. enterica serovar Virchow]EBS3953432.1 invasin [Salmonella enterica subsp. enterica serovar Augustenborg]EBV4255078.1 invasin [Salmonella enterica subsp. enterica serovar Java]ECF9260093.1 invasin [Salmonella enterica]ECH9901175.1 invasin [Salmonella enterica subsp. enterica]EEJ0376241.1 invasin [Salmonella enterica subsp. enterica serovar Stanleyville]EHK8254196.1 invasin [Salmonella enterica subsp. enterica serovar Braenderup]